ncbi:MAG: hypothetical protein UHN47_03510 [Lachnospiraceae bacterium]|nr:hypothetical protein [Lachnospiraceae bacterium]
MRNKYIIPITLLLVLGMFSVTLGYRVLVTYNLKNTITAEVQAENSGKTDNSMKYVLKDPALPIEGKADNVVYESENQKSNEMEDLINLLAEELE